MHLRPLTPHIVGELVTIHVHLRKGALNALVLF